MVDVCRLLGQGRWLVDDVLRALGGLERRVGRVLVDGDHVQRSVLALVQEHLVALLDDDNVPGVDGAGRAHEHGQHAVGGEDGGLVLVGELLDDGVGRRGDVVGGAVDGVELLLGRLDGLLVVGAVVVGHEAVAVNVLAVVGVQVELKQPVVVDLLEQLPVGADVDGGVAVALRLVVVLPAEATAAAATATGVIPSTAPAVVATPAATTAAELLTATATAVLPSSGTAALATAATCEDGATAESGLAAVANVGDDGEGGFVLLDSWCCEEGGACRAVSLLVWRERLVSARWSSVESSMVKQSAVMPPVKGRTSVVPVVLGPSSTTIAAVLAISGPVGHATQLVALGEGGVWDTIQGGLCRDWGPPSVAVGQRRDDVGDRFRHGGYCVLSSEVIRCNQNPGRVNFKLVDMSCRCYRSSWPASVAALDGRWFVQIRQKLQKFHVWWGPA